MNKLDVIWGGAVTMGAVRALAPRVCTGASPGERGVVLAMNHFSWLDPPRSEPPRRAPSGSWRRASFTRCR